MKGLAEVEEERGKWKDFKSQRERERVKLQRQKEVGEGD